MKSLNNTEIIICGIVRNAEKGLKRNVPVIKELCKQFKSYRVVLFENDSIDKTKSILAQWMQDDSEHVTAIMEDMDSAATIPKKVSKVGANRFYCHKRIDKMAVLRNQYMDYIDKHEWNADFLMVVDLDVEQIYASPIIEALSQDKEWDAITAYGYGINSGFKRCYYDTYALTLWEDRDVIQTEEIISVKNHCLDSVKKTDGWIRVASAFGGIAIYRFDAVKGLRYEAYDNDDERVEVRCEHFSIYKQMRERGYDQFYIVPSMQLKYQTLTWAVIKRRLNLEWHKYILRD